MLKESKSEIGKIYSEVSQLRQAQDHQWILNLLSNEEYENIADICCGSGNFIKDLIARKKIKNHVVCIDKSASMIKQAENSIRKENTGSFFQIDFICADLCLEKPVLDKKFDLVTMMSALHWLYPNEHEIFSWIHTLMDSKSQFYFTSYHPDDYDEGYAGTDLMVYQALQKIRGTSKQFLKIIPISTRTRKIENILEITRKFFNIEHAEKKSAVMCVNSSEEYISYHKATFGDYYLEEISPNESELFFSTLGEIAMDRMKKRGFVTCMDVWLHSCSRP